MLNKTNINYVFNPIWLTNVFATDLSMMQFNKQNSFCYCWIVLLFLLLCHIFHAICLSWTLYCSDSQPCSWRPHNTACFPCLLNQTHLIQIISSLVETPRPEMGLSDKGEMHNLQCWGSLLERGWEPLLYCTEAYTFHFWSAFTFVKEELFILKTNMQTLPRFKITQK